MGVSYELGTPAAHVSALPPSEMEEPFPTRAIWQLSYRDTSLIRNSADLGPYSRAMPRALWWSQGGGQFLMSEVPLQIAASGPQSSWQATLCWAASAPRLPTCERHESVTFQPYELTLQGSRSR